ncbi:MAG TPA: phosphodiester glycosidase family protein [Steroidobacteraceae bacterium]|nr:phosphodiester glycosidase family protein [Steroidobacteraceae bacterium]
MNAGMFHADFRPVGLLVVDGRTLGPINRSSGHGNFFLQPNGVFMVDADGARVLATHVYRNAEPGLATQSGPMLLDRGLIPDIIAFRPTSTSRFIRNGVCAQSPQLVVFVISEGPVNFFEFARFFRDSLGCRDALYLDGSVSSLYAPQLGRADRHSRLGPMFAVTR